MSVPATRQAQEHIPRDLADLGVELPLLPQAVAVLDGGTLARRDDAELLGRLRLPYPHITVI